MREIKFRAWLKKYCEMQYGISSIDFFDGGRIPLDSEIDAKHNYVWEEDYYLMQYVGLKDRNGTEIYEGDICLVTETNKYGCVVFDTNTCSFVIKPFNRTEGNWVIDKFLANKYFEVVGNIYEDPDPLEEHRLHW